jgi:hypothetical protein
MIPLIVHEVKLLLAAALVPGNPWATPPDGPPGDDATRPDPAGITCARLSREYALDR